MDPEKRPDIESLIDAAERTLKDTIDQFKELAMRWPKMAGRIDAYAIGCLQEVATGSCPGSINDLRESLEDEDEDDE